MISGLTRIDFLRSWGRRFPNWVQVPLKKLAIAAERMLSSAPASITDTQPTNADAQSALAGMVRHGPFLSHAEHIFGIEAASSLHPTARIFVRQRADGTFGKVFLGPRAYLGSEVEIAALGKISIGEDTSIQNYCIIHGDVSVGAHCLFGPFILIGSTTHRFRDRPFWHIRDQDELIQQRPELAVQPLSDPIIIEDDCWLGSSTAVMPGVYIGRGAVIGANCVVTRDVGPFEIHGGIPNQKIGRRLEFMPPPSITAMDDLHIPYFYRGLRTELSSLRESRKNNMIICESSACLILASHDNPKVLLDFVRADCTRDVFVRVRINGHDCGVCQITGGRVEFGINLNGKIDRSDVPRCLAGYTYVELDLLEDGRRGGVFDRDRYGIRSAVLVSD